MAEEVHNPAVDLPRAIVYSIPIGALAGLVFLLPIVFTLPNIQTLLSGVRYCVECYDPIH
jgi:amino acid transporter